MNALLDEIEACVQSIPRFAAMDIEWWVNPETVNSIATLPKLMVFVNFPSVDSDAYWEDQAYTSYQVTIEHKYEIATAYPNDKASMTELHAVAKDMRAIVASILARQKLGSTSLQVDIKQFGSQKIGIIGKIAEVSHAFTVSVLEK